MPAEATLWVGTAGEMEEELVPRSGLPLETISGGGMHGVGLRSQLRNGWRLACGWLQARRVVDRFQPDVLLLTGGYTNGPVALAAWERRLPMVIFLPDIEPGLAVRTLSRVATRVACTAEASKQYFPAEKLVVTGYPVRPDLVPNMTQAEARIAFNLRSDVATLLVFGGSRGARSINSALLEILPELLVDYQVIHISGELDWERVTAIASGLDSEQRVRYRPFSYLHEEMGCALLAADLAVSRAGAATLGEFPACSLPAILVPYPHAWRYQKVNADYMAMAGAALRLNDEDLTRELLPTITRLMGDRSALETMRAASHKLDRPDAAQQVADLLRSLSGEGSQ